MVSTTSAAVPSGSNPLRAVTTSAFWLGAAHLLLDAVFGFVYTFALGVGLFFTLILLPFALTGLPVWILTTWVSTALARVERARYRMLLGVSIEAQPMPPAERNPLRYGGILWRDEGVRRRAVHQLVAFPVGLFTSGVVYLVLSGGLGLLVSAPVLALTGPPDGDAQRRILGMPLSETPAGQLVLAGVGLLLLVVAPAVIRMLVTLDVAVAQALLGPAPGYLARRVDELERSRARVVDAGEPPRRPA
jgi:hypothetical protein